MRERVVVGVGVTDRGEETTRGVEVTPELQGMLERHPLPEGVPDSDDMNQNEMAAALGVTVNTLGKWLSDETFPTVQRGGLGKQYKLCLSHCYAWKMDREASEDLRRLHNQDAISKMQATLLGLELDDPHASLSVKDHRALLELDVVRTKAKRDRRAVVAVEDMADLLESVLGIMRNGMQGMSDRLERELGLKPEQVAMVDRVASDTLNELVSKIEAAELEELEDRDVANSVPTNQLLI